MPYPVSHASSVTVNVLGIHVVGSVWQRLKPNILSAIGQTISLQSLYLSPAIILSKNCGLHVIHSTTPS